MKQTHPPEGQPALAEPDASLPPGDRRERALALLSALRAGERQPEGLPSFAGLSLVDADFSGLDLTGADLSGADLSRANFSGATLFRANLRGAQCYAACFDDAECSGADFSNAHCERASFVRAGLGRAQLVGCVLREANLERATLTDADLRDASLTCAKLQHARVRGANLDGSDCARADMRDTELERTSVRGACFERSDLRAANLAWMKGYERAYWIGADLRGIEFTGAHLCRRFILDQNYLEEFRTRGRLSALIYRVWWLTSDCGRSALRWGACTFALALLFGMFYTQVPVDYGEYPTSFSPIYFSVVTLTTLGFGDVVPKSELAQLVVMTQVLLGYVMLGGLLSIFSNKMARRAD